MKKRFFFPLLIMAIMNLVFGSCVVRPIVTPTKSSIFVAATSMELSQPAQIATITPTVISEQTVQAEPNLLVTLREMQFVPNNSACRSVDLDQIQLEGDILFRSARVGGGFNLIKGAGGLVRTQNLYWNEEIMEAFRISDDGLWTVALFQEQVGHTNFLEATGWVLINNLNGDVFQGSWDLEEEYYYMGWEIYSSDESGVQMLLFPKQVSDPDRYFSEMELFFLPAGEVRDLGLDAETSEIYYYGKFPPPITFSPQRNKVIFFTFKTIDLMKVHTLFDIKNNRELWSAPEGLQRPHFSIPFWLWAPDSSVIVMPFHHISTNSEENPQADLYMLDSDGNSIERLTTFRESIDREFIVEPHSWSVDSQKLLVIVEGEQRYYILDFEQNQIIQSCQFQWMRSFGGLWSIDGTRVIFEMGDREHGYSLVEMDASSGDANIAETEYYWLKLLYWYQE